MAAQQATALQRVSIRRRELATEETVPPSLGGTEVPIPQQTPPTVPRQATAQSLPMMLPEVSLMMTLVDCKAGVVLQNSASISYFGDLTGQRSSLSDLLGSLMGSDPDRVPTILNALAESKPWKGTVRVPASLLDCPPEPSEAGEVTTSPSALFNRLSLANTALCTQGLDVSSESLAPPQAPKLRFLLNTVSRNQSSSANVLHELSPHELSVSQSCTELSALQARSAKLCAPTRKVHSFIARKSSPIPRITMLQSASTDPRTESTTTAADLLLPLPTAPPTIAPRAPLVAASGGLATPPPALTHQGAPLEAMRLIFPSNTGRPRFDENSIMAAMGSSSSGVSQLLTTLQSQGSAEHRSRSNVAPCPQDTLSLVAEATSDGEADMAFFSGLFGLAGVTEVPHEAPKEAEQQLGGNSPAASAWHEVEAVPMVDPVTHQQMVMLIQRVVTEQVASEHLLTTMTESQLNVLQQMFPRHVLELMLGGGVSSLVGGGRVAKSLARSHDSVTILFLDVVGFTSMSKHVQPAEVMAFLSELFSLFDELVDQYGVYKVETAGDCYIVAGGLMQHEEHGFMSVGDAATSAVQGAERVMAFAKALIRCSRAVTTPHDQQPCRVRVGIHTGPVVSGLIGRKLPKFSIFGDTMNTASRMESTSKPGCIQVSAATHALLESHSFEPTGGVEVKGKGIMETFLWDPAVHPEQHYMHPADQAKEAAAILNHGLDKAALRAQHSIKPAVSSPALLPSGIVRHLAFPAPGGAEPNNPLLARLLVATMSSAHQPTHEPLEPSASSQRLVKTYQ